MDEMSVADDLLMKAARGGKYYKRIPKAGGGYRYFYSKDAYEKHMEKQGGAHVDGERASKESKAQKAHKMIKKLAADGKSKGEARQAVMDSGLITDKSAASRAVLDAWPKDTPAEAGQKMAKKSIDPAGSGGSMSKLMKSQAQGLGLDLDDAYEADLFKSLMAAPELGAPETLTKGLYAFSHYSDKPQRLPDDYLAAYLDAFIEEAYEHECRESKHRGGRIQHGDAEDYMARMVYNELMIYAVKNSNLLRACKKVKCSTDYIKMRLKGMGLAYPNTSQEDAERDAAVGGYHPRAVGEGEAHGAEYMGTSALERSFVAAERDMKKAVEQGSALAQAPQDIVVADDRGDPAAALRKGMTDKVNEQWGFGTRREDRVREVPVDKRVDFMPPSAPLSDQGKSRTH